MKENMDSVLVRYSIAEKQGCGVRAVPDFILLRNSIAEFDFAVKKYVAGLRFFMKYAGLYEMCGMNVLDFREGATESCWYVGRILCTIGAKYMARILLLNGLTVSNGSWLSMIMTWSEIEKTDQPIV